MDCPECGSNEVESIGKRNFPYPIAFLAVLPLAFAMLHQASSPFDYRCPRCGLHFARRTDAGRFALGTVFVIIFAVPVVFVFSLRGCTN